eukprot:TRINITY_DN15147_c0_g1_i1.p4 TRINITY_DN15147_c0_g1~~TRINITY_DN15147_c0_g1_i1.p4  ORF type:complete len:143 (-),score=11.69 TRINITY_DN15147_c0_g1_i1:2-430(-)
MIMIHKYIYKKIVAIIISLLIGLTGVICINITNTKALSPLGNTNENYKLVNEEFGEDFSNFIKDNSILKIYKEDSDILVRIGENNFRITNKSSFFNKDKVHERKQQVQFIFYYFLMHIRNIKFIAILNIYMIQFKKMKENNR